MKQMGWPGADFGIRGLHVGHRPHFLNASGREKRGREVHDHGEINSNPNIQGYWDYGTETSSYKVG